MLLPWLLWCLELMGLAIQTWQWKYGSCKREYTFIQVQWHDGFAAWKEGFVQWHYCSLIMWHRMVPGINRNQRQSHEWKNSEAKSFSRDFLKKGGERMWKRPKQVFLKWKDCQRRGLILTVSGCEVADVFQKFSVNLSRQNYSVKELCKSDTPGWLAPGWTPQGWTSNFPLSQDPCPTEISKWLSCSHSILGNFFKREVNSASFFSSLSSVPRASMPCWDTHLGSESWFKSFPVEKGMELHPTWNTLPTLNYTIKIIHKEDTVTFSGYVL